MYLTTTIQITADPVYFETTNGISILSIICKTEDLETIEVIAFNTSAEEYKYYFKYRNVYKLENVYRMDNEKYKKTNNKYKLEIDKKTSIQRIKRMQYKRRGLVFVAFDNNDNKYTNKNAQLSITNFLSRSKTN